MGTTRGAAVITINDSEGNPKQVSQEEAALYVPVALLNSQDERVRLNAAELILKATGRIV